MYIITLRKPRTQYEKFITFLKHLVAALFKFRRPMHDLPSTIWADREMYRDIRRMAAAAGLYVDAKRQSMRLVCSTLPAQYRLAPDSHFRPLHLEGLYVPDSREVVEYILKSLENPMPSEWHSGRWGGMFRRLGKGDDGVDIWFSERTFRSVKHRLVDLIDHYWFFSETVEINAI